MDASGKVELEDWVEVRAAFFPSRERGLTASSSQLNVKLRQQAPAVALPSKAGKVTVAGSNANVAHTINEDERSEFTHHINSVSVEFGPPYTS